VPLSQKQDCLSFIQNNKDLINQAMAPVAKGEDSFKIECILNVNKIVDNMRKKESGVPEMVSVCCANFKDLKVIGELSPKGIDLSLVFSITPTFPFYAQLAKESYTLPSLTFGQNENTPSYSVSRDVSWIFDMLKFGAHKFYNEISWATGWSKQTLDEADNVLDNAKKCIAGGQFLGLFPYGGGFVPFEVRETSCKTVDEYVNCKDSLFVFSEKMKALPGKVKQTEILSILMTDNEKSKVEDKADTKSILGPVNESEKLVKSVCEYKGHSIYVKEWKNEPLSQLIKKEEYLMMRDGLLLSSTSLDFLKSQIDVLVVEKMPIATKIPAATPETLIDGCPPGMIAKGKVQIVSFVQFLNTQIPALKKYFTDAVLAKIDANGEVSFEIMAQGEGSVAIRGSLNNSFLRALPVFMEILINMSADYNRQQNETSKSMIPLKADESKKQNFIPIKKDDVKENSSLIPVKVTYNREVDPHRDEKPTILIPVKILTEYKAVG
jgi:hypothetical protein